MRTKDIKADTIDAAAELILDELKNTRSRENAIYFDGWDGLGASAVLRAVAQRLAPKEQTSPQGLEFEQVIHIDSSKWESRRAVQREISEQLKLPGWVRKMFDKQDEDDDFSGMDQGSRTEIAEVTAEIHRSMQSRRFLLVLHNGSSEEIDTFNLGLSLYGYLSSKLLWTFQGRFRLDPKLRDKVVAKNTTDVLLLASRSERDPHDLRSYLVHEEATQVSCKQAATVAKCYSYMLERSYMSQNIIEYDWTLHGPNFWICDGIIQQTQGMYESWQVANALHQQMRLCIDKFTRHTSKEDDLHTSHMTRSADHQPYWISTETCGFVLNPGGLLRNSIFNNSNQISVLKLSRCAFSFSSPPFLCCHRLRFLWLDRCQDLQRSIDSQEEKDTTRLWACFQSLWVLDLRYMDWSWILSADIMDLMTQLMELNIMGAKDWDMSRLRGRLRNIRKLRITKSTCRNYDSSLLSEMEQMEILEFSGNDITSSGTSSLTLCSAARRGSGLQTVIVDGSVGLKKISLQGCDQLKNVLLRGLLESLEELDLSGTNLQTIDLSAMHELKLKRLLLLGCQKLRAILWPRELNTKWLDVLRIDTTSRSASDSGGGENIDQATSARSSSILHEGEGLHAHPHGHESLKEQKGRLFNKYRISMTDARFLRSLLPVMYAFSINNYHWDITHGSVHVDICSLGGRIIHGTSSSSEQVQTKPHRRTLVDSKYRDAFEKAGLANSYDDCGNGPTPSAVTMTWDCPKIDIPIADRTCMIEMLVDGCCSELMEDAQIASNSGLSSPHFPDPIYNFVTSLHVYDCPTITSIYAPQRDEAWPKLRWCRVERCPKIHTVFHTPRDSQIETARLFDLLHTFWASQLLKAHYISNWPSVICHLGYYSFYNLELLHLDYCPRLIHVLPIHVYTTQVLHHLGTIEIICCGDLREIFPLHFYRENQKAKTIVFPMLKRVHLHEVAKLQRICGLSVVAPMLKTVKIRGCWSLKRLPALAYYTKPPKVDCEKDWWDSLEWDGLEVKHHPSLYEPVHSAYYKKNLPGVSLLR